MKKELLILAACLALPAWAQVAVPAADKLQTRPVDSPNRMSAEALGAFRQHHHVEPDKSRAALHVVDVNHRVLGRLEGVDRVILYHNGAPVTVQLAPDFSGTGPVRSGGLTWDTSTVIFYDRTPDCSGPGYIYRILPGTELFGQAVTEGGRTFLLLARTTGLHLISGGSAFDPATGNCTARASASYATPIEASIPLDGRWTPPFFVE